MKSFPDATTTRDAGPASKARLDVIAGINKRDARVPCGTCTACCRMSTPVELVGDEVERFPSVTAGDGLHYLPKQADGMTCALFNDGVCSVYETRPMTCRKYDCRTQGVFGTQNADVYEKEGYVPFSVSLDTREDLITFVSARLTFAGLMQYPQLRSSIADLTIMMAPGMRNHAVVIVNEWLDSKKRWRKAGLPAEQHGIESLIRAIGDYGGQNRINWEWFHGHIKHLVIDNLSDIEAELHQVRSGERTLRS